MSETRIFVLYDEMWDETTKKFVDHKCKLVLVPNDTNFEGLLEKLYLALEKDSDDYRLTMKFYTCIERFASMDVNSDEDVQFFMDLAKMEKPCPLYVSTVRREEDPGLGFSGTNHFLDVSFEPLRKKCFEIFQQGIDFREQNHGQSQPQCGSEQGLEPKEKDCPVMNQLAKRDDDGSKKSVDKGNDEATTIYTEKLFQNIKTLYFALSIDAISGKFQFVVEMCSTDVLVVRCFDDKCKWRVRANKSSSGDNFRVIEYNNVHTCSREIIKGEHRQATCWLVEQLIWSMYDVPGLVYKPDAIVEYMQSKLGVHISHGKACKARQNVLDILKMSPKGLYSRLPSYCALMESKNRGTIVHVETNNENRFKYFFMALHASIQGWLTCRPVIAIDATSMEAYGMLFAVTCKDGNDQIFPLAFGIVDSENDESWDWFLTKFKEAFEARDNLVVISKHTESICKAVNKVYPKIENYICLQHLLQDVNAKFKKELEIESLFYSASEAYHVSKFGKLMYKIKCADERIYDYLFKVGCEKWARVHFTGNRYNIMRTDIAEFLNGTAEKVGHLSAIAVVGHLTLTLEDLFSKRRNEASKMTSKLTKWAEDVLQNKSTNSLSMKVCCLQDKTFQVTDGAKNVTVVLRGKTCTCREFELDQMPCSHALAVLREQNMLDQLPYSFCSHYYTLECLVQTYAETVHPLGSYLEWKAPGEVKLRKVLPPTMLPSGVRRLKEWTHFLEEEEGIQKCDICGNPGHNRQTCIHRFDK